MSVNHSTNLPFPKVPAVPAYFQGEYVTSERLLYTPSEFAKQNLLYLQEIGRLTAQKPHTSKRQGLSSFLFFHVLSGSGQLTYGGQTYEAVAGDCVFINCEEAYSHTTHKDDLWTLQWVHFYSENLPAIYQKYLERGGQPVFHTSGSGTLFPGAVTGSSPETLWSRLNATAHSTDFIRDIRINESLSGLISFIMSYSWNPALQKQPKEGQARSYVSAVKDYLESHYGEKITLDNLADRFLVNKYTLSKDFKKQYGTSVINSLLLTRITHAKQLLRFTRLSVDEIGAACGITPLYYFSRIFKQIEGVSPSEYRQRWK